MMDIVENVGQLEQAPNNLYKYNFPVVTIYPNYLKRIYLNSLASKYVDFDKVEYFFNSEYIVMLPA